MKAATAHTTQAPQTPQTAAEIAAQRPLRRRRLGLAVLAVAVVALASQSLVEWLLPADRVALEQLQRWLHWPGLGHAQVAWAWALPCVLLLAALARAPQRPGLAVAARAVACGAALGSAQLAVGGVAALALLLLAGLASLGWQGRAEGGLVLLLAAAAAVAGWDWVLSPQHAWQWAPVLVLVAVLVWVDRQHIRTNDRRLFGALVERDALIASLAERSAELGALQRARTRLLAAISHDLRQPLQAVRLFAEALQRHGGADPAQAQELLVQQMRAADDAVAMLDQFSEFSAIEQGALQSHPEPVDLRALLDGIAATLRAAHLPAQLTLKVHGRHHWLHTDRTQLARLLQNLAGNAVRYSLGARPGVRARVVLAVRPRRQRDGSPGLAVDVVDNGRGIPPDKLDAVFEPYVQLGSADGSVGRAGHGLGLAIVRGLAAQLGLQLAPLRSTIGRGTRMRVLLPAALRRPAPAAAAEAPQASASGFEPAAAIPDDDATRLDGWLLALLDDEEAPRAALRAALEGAGATTVDAATPDLLRQRLDDEPRFPDALVFDLDLGPGRPDGLAAVAALRGEWDLALPAVIITGRVAALGSVQLPGVCALLAKPVALAVLVGTLRRLRQQQTQTQAAA